MNDHAQAESDVDQNDDVCGDYPEHDFQLLDERDGIRSYECHRCGAEMWDGDDDD